MMKYGDITLLLPIKVDEQLIKAIILFWDPSYQCFTLNQKDLISTIEEYSALLRIAPPNLDRVFWKKAKKVSFKKKLAQMMNMNASVLDSKTKQKGRNEYVQCDFLKEYILKNNDDDQVMDMFALTVYGIMIFPQSSRYVDATVVDLIEQMDNQINHVPAIVAETIQSLNYCRRKSK